MVLLLGWLDAVTCRDATACGFAPVRGADSAYRSDTKRCLCAGRRRRERLAGD